jgi:hypothetical protein
MSESKKSKPVVDFLRGISLQVPEKEIDYMFRMELLVVNTLSAINHTKTGNCINITAMSLYIRTWFAIIYGKTFAEVDKDYYDIMRHEAHGRYGW